MADRLNRTTQKVSDLAFLDVTGRVARTLLELTKQPDAMTHPDGMQIKITRQEIGRIVGCSREMVGRVLKTLVDQGLVSVKGKTMVVLGVEDITPEQLEKLREIWTQVKPKSISWGDLDHDDFQPIFHAAVALGHKLLGVDPVDLLNEAQE